MLSGKCAARLAKPAASCMVGWAATEPKPTSFPWAARRQRRCRLGLGSDPLVFVSANSVEADLSSRTLSLFSLPGASFLCQRHALATSQASRALFPSRQLIASTFCQRHTLATSQASRAPFSSRQLVASSLCQRHTLATSQALMIPACSGKFGIYSTCERSPTIK